VNVYGISDVRKTEMQVVELLAYEPSSF